MSDCSTKSSVGLTAEVQRWQRSDGGGNDDDDGNDNGDGNYIGKFGYSEEMDRIHTILD